jgi:predicted PurR-regulated permease PerM
MTSKETFYARVVALIVAAALGYALFLIFAPFARELAWAAFLAFLLHPVNLRLRRRVGGRGKAASVLAVLVPLCLLLPLSAVSVAFVAQVHALSLQLQAAVIGADLHSVADLQHLSWFAALDRWLADNFDISAQTIRGWLVTGTHTMLEHAAGFGGSLFLGTVSSLFGLGLTLVLLYFFLCDGDAMLGRARSLIPLHAERTERLFSGLGSIARAIVFGTTLTAVLQGVLLGIGFRLVGLPSPVVFGVLGALIAMLPAGGTALIWVPATAWLFLDHHPGLGAVMLVWGVVLSGLDNVLKPMLISGRATVSPLVVFLGVLGGIGAFGAIGMIAGPVLVSLAIALLEFAEEERSRAAVQSAP